MLEVRQSKEQAAETQKGEGRVKGANQAMPTSNSYQRAHAGVHGKAAPTVHVGALCSCLYPPGLELVLCLSFCSMPDMGEQLGRQPSDQPTLWSAAAV